MNKAIAVLLIGGVVAVAAHPAAAQATEMQVHLNAVGASGLSGLVDLKQLTPSGTHITVDAFGLMPGGKYVSLYYDNAVCHLEPYSVHDVIGKIYTANAGGVGATAGNADNNLAKINSVSVREAGSFKLLACAMVQQADKRVTLSAVGASGVSGPVALKQLTSSGTHITLDAFGLTPGNKYVSLYYDNSVCRLEPYSVHDVIGKMYTANADGVGTTAGNADDNLAKINSVSVREAGSFKLLACATVHRSGKAS